MGRKKRRERASRFQKDLSKYTGWNRQNYFPFFHQAHQPRRSPPFLNIERKTFYFKQMEDDRKFRISEEGKVYSEILLELGCVRWSVDALGAASMYRGRTPFFRKWRCPNAILLFQVFSNSKGRFGVLSKEYFRGRKQSIFIPEGGNGEGWMNFIKRLEFFLPKPYGRVINETLIEKEGEPVKGLENPESDNESEAGVPMKLAFDPNKTIIVRRSKASDDWWLIRQAVEEKFKVMVNLRPCCGNLAVGLCATMQDAVTVCNQVMVSVGGMEVELQWWDSKFLLEKQKMVFSSGWVEIVGIPPQLRTEEIVSKIAGLCGGLVDLDGIKGMWGLHENIFVNVKGFEDGFIPVGSSINQGNVDFPLRFLRCNIMEEEDLLSEKSVNLSSLDEADLVDDMDVVSEKGEALLGDLKKAVEVDNYVTPDSLSSKQEGQEKGKSVLEEEVIAEASFFHENFGCEGKNLGRDTLLDTDLENVPLGVELLDENLENQCSSQDSFDSDHDVNSFVSTPKQSFQSYEDFQLLYDSSPILIAPEDSSPHVSASKLDFTVKAVNRVKVADAAPALIDSEFEFLEKMMSGDQGNTLERGLERGSSCSVEEMSGTHEIKEDDINVACQAEDSDFEPVLKPYQLVGVNFLLLLYRKGVGGAILADEMGLGKTIQAITYLMLLKYLNNDPGPHLIVCPASVLENWERELKKWCPSFSVLQYHGAGRSAYSRELNSQAKAGLPPPFNVLLVCYSLFERHSAQQKDERRILKRWKWSCVLMDEAHALKDKSSYRWKNLMNLARNAKQRLMLTGTPLQNDLHELWSLLEFMMPNIFATEDVDLKKLLTAENSSLISHMKFILGPFILRRLKSDVMQQLVPKIQQVQYVVMEKQQEDAYMDAIEEYRNASRARIDRNPKANLNNIYGILPRRQISNYFVQFRKIANHPLLVRRIYNDQDVARYAEKLHPLGAFGFECSVERVVEELKSYNDFVIHRLLLTYGISDRKGILSDKEVLRSAKCKALAQLLPSLKQDGHRVLIFSQWTSMLDILEWTLDVIGLTYRRLDGSTQVAERQTIVDTFNNDTSIFACLLSTRAGGQGLNLTGADTVVIHDMDFNPQIDRQAEDRCHRIGQSRPVTVYRLVTKGTVDENIYEIAKRKLVLDAAVLESGTEMDNERESADNKTMGEILSSILLG